MTHPQSGTAIVYKRLGETPLQCVERYKKKHPELASVTISYAGRLDPMAEGMLLLLVGDENKRRRIHEHLPKEYELSILFGFSTDTGDLMGEVTGTQISKLKCQIKSKIQVSKSKLSREEHQTADERTSLIFQGTVKEILPRFVGTISQRYPAYSSVKVKGKPLYWWARKSRLHEIIIPTHSITIKPITLLKQTDITPKDIHDYINQTIPYVKGDFRQSEIINKWKNVLLSADPSLNYPLITLRVTCTSGTYMRVLAEDIGNKLCLPAVAFSIKRTALGDITLNSLNEIR